MSSGMVKLKIVDRIFSIILVNVKLKIKFALFIILMLPRYKTI